MPLSDYADELKDVKCKKHNNNFIPSQCKECAELVEFFNLAIRAVDCLDELKSLVDQLPKKKRKGL